MSFGNGQAVFPEEMQSIECVTVSWLTRAVGVAGARRRFGCSAALLVLTSWVSKLGLVASMLQAATPWYSGSLASGAASLWHLSFSVSGRLSDVYFLGCEVAPGLSVASASSDEGSWLSNHTAAHLEKPL